MSGKEEKAALEAGAEAGVSLGKGAWDCDAKCEIPPEKEASSFAVRVHRAALKLRAYITENVDRMYCRRLKSSKSLPPWTFRSRAFPQYHHERIWIGWSAPVPRPEMTGVA